MARAGMLPVSIAVIVCGVVSVIFGLISAVLGFGVRKDADNNNAQYCNETQSFLGYPKTAYCRILKNTGTMIILAGVAQVIIGIASAVLALLMGKVCLVVFGTGHALLVVPFFSGFSLMVSTAHHRKEYGRGSKAGKNLFFFMLLNFIYCFVLGIAAIPMDFFWRYHNKHDKVKFKDEQGSPGASPPHHKPRGSVSSRQSRGSKASRGSIKPNKKRESKGSVAGKGSLKKGSIKSKKSLKK